MQGIRRHGALYPFRIGPGLCFNGICRGGIRRLLISGYPGSSEKIRTLFENGESQSLCLISLFGACLGEYEYDLRGKFLCGKTPEIE